MFVVDVLVLLTHFASFLFSFVPSSCLGSKHFVDDPMANGPVRFIADSGGSCIKTLRVRCNCTKLLHHFLLHVPRLSRRSLDVDHGMGA